MIVEIKKNTMKTLFKVGDIEKTKKGTFQCVCADKETAVFAPKKGRKVTYRNMYARTNRP